MKAVDYLSRVSLFSHLKKKDLERIGRLSQQQVFHQGDIIIKEGDRDGRLFVVLTGEVEVIKGLGGNKERCFGTLGPGSYFGEMALIDDYVRSASVTATKETTVLSIDQWDLRQEILKHPMLAVELLQLLNRRIQVLEKSMMDCLGKEFPICGRCKKIRTENDSWVPMDEYVKDYIDAESTHSLCPECKKSFQKTGLDRATTKKCL